MKEERPVAGRWRRHPAAFLLLQDLQAYISTGTPANLFTPLLQATPLPNFFLAGSYTKQDYIDSMEGATLSGRQCAAEILKAAPGLLPKAGAVAAAARST